MTEAWEDRNREKDRRRSRLKNKKSNCARKSGRPMRPAPEVEDFDDINFVDEEGSCYDEYE